jgi:hypothetical protein
MRPLGRIAFVMMISCTGLLIPSVVWAQSAPMGLRRGFRPMMQGEPPIFNFIGGKTVTGAPFSAQVTFEHSQTLPDGNFIHHENSAMVYRDSQGRTRIEQTRPSNSGNPQQIIRIIDPVAHVGYVLDPAKQIAHRFSLPPSRPGNFEAPRPTPSNPNVVSTSLGSNPNLNGVYVEGTQVTHTIPAGQLGNSEAIQITTVRWYSPDLGINISSQTTDPLRVNSTTSLTNISRNEPASTLFDVPSGYTVVNTGPMRPQRFGRGASNAIPQQ